jgi:lysophospholipase L1-like esterase
MKNACRWIDAVRKAAVMRNAKVFKAPGWRVFGLGMSCWIGLAVSGCAHGSGSSRVTPAGPGLFDSEIAAFKRQDAQAFPGYGRILFVGSSSIRRWVTLERDMQPVDVLNRGFGGAQIVHVNHYFRDIVAPYRPSAIVFYCGENDLFAGKSAATVVRDFERFLELRDQWLPATQVFFVSIKPSRARHFQLAAQHDVNRRIAGLAAAREDIVFVDVASAMLGDDGARHDLFVPDGLHMNATGYAIWTDAIRHALVTTRK